MQDWGFGRYRSRDAVSLLDLALALYEDKTTFDTMELAPRAVWETE